MIKRHNKIGFKQIVRIEWMNRALSLVLAGLPEKEIRNQLDTYLSTQQQRGGEGAIRNKATYGMSLGLLSCWFRKDPELEAFRQALLKQAKKLDQQHWLPLHWSMLVAAYPYFALVSETIGRLFFLQDVISSGQIYDRMKQSLGDKEMIARNTRYVIRTLVSWGLLIEDFQGQKGHYTEPCSYKLKNSECVALLLEGLLLALPEEKCEWFALQRHKSLYGFEFEISSAQHLERLSENRIVVSQLGLTTGMVAINKTMLK